LGLAALEGERRFAAPLVDLVVVFFLGIRITS
jgi:hypothetical protein